MLETIQFILKLMIGSSASGDVVVSSNVNEVEIKTGWTPRHVFISLENECGHHVCGSHHDWFDVKKTHRGFLIKCNVKSSFRKITWIATK